MIDNIGANIMKPFIIWFCVTTICIALPGSQAIHVTFCWDDGLDNQFAASEVMDAYNINATFYVNSWRIDRPQYLSLAQLNSIYSRGHEIGGQTKTHARLRQLNRTQQEDEICGDRAQLLQWGFNSASFAFPFGADTPEAYEILVNCGYNSARDSGGVRTNTSCTACPAGEYIPPKRPYLMRSISYKKSLGLDGLKWYIQQAEAEESSTGKPRWLNFVFHEFGDFPNKVQAITKPELESFLDWLKPREGMVIKPAGEIIGGQTLPILSDVIPDPNKIGEPYILFTFDDGTSDHAAVGSTFQSHEMRASFFINTDNIGLSGYLSVSDIQNLEMQGHEIGCHGRSGKHLLGLPLSEQTYEICGAKTVLENEGLTVSSQSWSFGETNAQLKAIASGCGFTLGRDIGGIKYPTGCGNCPKALKVPLSKPLALRSFIVKSYHTMGDLLWQIRQAEEMNTVAKRGLIFSFGRVCDNCAYSPQVLRDILVWLKARTVIGTAVVSLKTLGQ